MIKEEDRVVDSVDIERGEGNGLISRVFRLLSEKSKDVGVEVLRVKFYDSGTGRRDAKRMVLEVMIDSLTGRPGIDDCTRASNYFSAILDVEDIITSKYYLEIISAGIERPMVKLDDYRRFIGRQVAMRFYLPYKFEGKDDSKRLDGVIVGVDEKDNILIGGNGDVVYPVKFPDIKSAHLVMTDEMFRQLLRGEKK